MKFLHASTNIKMSPHTGAGRTPSKIWSGAQTYLGTDRGRDLGEDVKTISRPTPATPPPAQPSTARWSRSRIQHNVRCYTKPTLIVTLKLAINLLQIKLPNIFNFKLLFEAFPVRVARQAAIGFKEKITTQIFEKLYDIVLYERTTDFN